MTMTVDLTAVRKHMKELRQQRDHIQAELQKVEDELQTQERLNRLYAPLGYFVSHEQKGGQEIECEAIVLDISGDNLLIEYWMPSLLGRDGREEIGHLNWLQTPEERARFSSTRQRSNSLTFTRYMLAFGKKEDESKTFSTQDCRATRIELAKLETIEAFEQHDEDDLIVRLVDTTTRIVEFTVDKQTINMIRHAPQLEG